MHVCMHACMHAYTQYHALPYPDHTMQYNSVDNTIHKHTDIVDPADSCLRRPYLQWAAVEVCLLRKATCSDAIQEFG